MMINKKDVEKIVEIFYQPNFKLFYINSLDGEKFIKNIGIFVSLGITTSKKILEDIRDILNNNKEFKATIVEISSKKISGQYCNTIVNFNPEQYMVTDFGDNVMDKEKALSELEKLKSLMSPEDDIENLRIYAPQISKLSTLIEKLNVNNGWENHLIQNDDGDFKIFHKYVNYKKENDLEYRIGIYVTNNN